MIVRPQRFSCKVNNIIKLTTKIFWLTFKLVNPLEINFQAGQRCLFNVGPKRNNYSLCSSPLQKDQVETCVDTTPNGPGSLWIKSRKPGDAIDFLGPLGTFTVSQKPGVKVFIATGTGVSPLRSMILTLLEQNYKDPLYLYFGERYEEDIFWKNEFDSLTKKYSNFHYIIVLSQPRQTWSGNKGYVQDHLENNLLNKNSSEFYLCGNGKMIDGATQTLVKCGIKKEQILTERFYEVSL